MSLEAGSKYYKYYVKERPAEILKGVLGDHTYVCIKKKKYKKNKTVRNYGCFTVFGGTSGGKTYRTYKVRKNYWSKRMKDASIKTTKVWECGKKHWTGVYGIALCHQTTNRMLYALPGHPTLGRGINGYYYGPIQSRWTKGKYGKFGWNACRKATYGW